MRIILDTNVLVSGIFFNSGPPEKIVISFIEKKLNLVISPDILDEYIRIVTKLQAGFPNVNIHKFLDGLFRMTVMYVPDKLPVSVCQDPKDEMFLTCALASKTRIIVSGDKHLLKVSGFRGIKVLTPRQFVNQYLN